MGIATLRYSPMLNAVRPLLRPQAAAALGGLFLLEIIFGLMWRLGDLKLHVVETIALALAAGVVYFLALFLLEHTRESRIAFWAILAGALAFRLTLAPLAPSLSTDLYRYRWDGRIQEAGWNPYAVRPDDPRLAALAAAPDSHWAEMPGHEVPTIYPPVAELIYRLTWRALPDPVRFKLPFLLADLLVVGLLATWIRTTGGKNAQLAIYAWNPLVVVEFAASSHADALALAGIAVAAVIIRRRPVVSMLAVVGATLAKWFPAALVPLWLACAGWPRRRRGWVAVFAALALAVACIWPYRAAWLGSREHPRPQILDSLAYFQSRWQNNNASLHAAIVWFSGSNELAAGLAGGVVAGLALWVAARRLGAGRAAYRVFGAALLLAPVGYPWYFTWMVPLVAVLPAARSGPAWLLLSVLQFLSYNVLIDYQTSGRWHFDPLLQWLTYAPFYALLLAEALRSRPRSCTPGDGARLRGVPR